MYIHIFFKYFIVNSGNGHMCEEWILWRSFGIIKLCQKIGKKVFTN